MPHNHVLVTGGCGFIGSELVTQLANTGKHVLILDNLTTGQLENLKHINQSQYTFINGDVRDSKLLSQILPEVNIVYHLACLGVRHSIQYPQESHDVNATGTLCLLEALRTCPTKRFIYISSSEVYGSARTVPMDETHPTFPTTAYGASKLAGEAYARAFHKTYGLSTVIVRPFNTYGPRCHHEGSSGEVIPRFILRLLAGKKLITFGDGEQTRDFTYVEDTARGIILASESEKTIGLTINLGSGQETSIRQLAHTLADIMHLPLPLIHMDQQRPGDLRRLVADTKLANSLIGFTPSLTLDQGLEKLIQWYYDLGISAEYLLKDEILHNWKDEQKVVSA